MTKTISIITLCIINLFSFSQIVESSCEAPDSIIEDYNIDAGILTLRKFYENDLPYKDSIEIPSTHVDTFQNALLAVWNATELPARDTVVDILEISTVFDYDIRAFRFKCDNTHQWANNLINGLNETGNETLDSLIDIYQLEYLTHLSGVDYYYIYLSSNTNYNMPVLSKKFEIVPEVISVYATSGQYPYHIQNNITSEIYTDYIDLEYSYGWGDCLNGCFFWRYWDFRVYYDCSVEYLGSHGDLLSGSIIDSPENYSLINIYPNPFFNIIKIEGMEGMIEYTLYNTNGYIIQKGLVQNNIIYIKDSIISGIYLLEIKNSKTVITKKIFKH